MRPLLTVAVAIVLAACSGDGVSEQAASSVLNSTTLPAQPSSTSSLLGQDGASLLAEALGESAWASYQAETEEGNVPFEISREQAFCLGEMLVDVIGYEELDRAGVTVEVVERQEAFDPEELYNFDWDDEQLTLDYFNGVSGCIDLAGFMTSAFSLELGIAAGSAGCLVNGMLADEAISSSLARSFANSFGATDPFSDPGLTGDLFGLFSGCLTDEELRDLGFPTQPGSLPDLEGWEVPDGYITHDSKTFGYAIAFPADWLVLELENNEPARSEVMALLEGAYEGEVPELLLSQMAVAIDQGLSLIAFVGLPEPDALYTPTFALLALPLQTGTDLDELEATLPIQIAAIPGSEFAAMERIVLPDGEAIHAEYTLNLDGLTVPSDYYILLGGSWAYAISMGDLTDRPNRRTYETILDTFRSVGP